MLQKRKLIKKTHVAPQSSETKVSQAPCLDLIQQLKSHDLKIKQDAISVVANLQQIPDDKEFETQLYSNSVLIELINVIVTGADASFKQIAIFAISNLYQIIQHSHKQFVHTLFQLGLDKALMTLDTTNMHLIKPILILMGNIAEHIPSAHIPLLQLMQQNLVQNPAVYLSPPIHDLTIQFLLKSGYRVKNPLALTPQQINSLSIFKNIAENDKMYRNRAIAARLLNMSTGGLLNECIAVYCNLFQQILSDLDLQKQYQMNFNQTKQQQQQQQIQNEQWSSDSQEQEQGNIMTQQPQASSKHKQKGHKKSKNKNKKKEEKKDKMNEQLSNKDLKNIKKQQKQEQQSSFNIFIDALEGLQLVLQFVVEMFQDQQNYQEEEEEDMDEEEQVRDQVSMFDKTIFMNMIQPSICKVINHIHKFTCLSFIQGQNIIELILQLLTSLPTKLTSPHITPTTITISTIVSLCQQTLINNYKYQLSHPHAIPSQVFIYNTKLALSCVLKYKCIQNRSLYVQLPHIRYQDSKGDGKKLMAVNSKWKDVWILLLQIYSMFYNPEKVPTVTESENSNIGGVLKQLIIQIPEIQLEQWRGQTIDTLFDIYSNENFDKTFMQYGFVDILNQVLKVASGNNKIGSQGNKKDKKSNKFINAVISDIHRFLQYKKKMIGF